MKFMMFFDACTTAPEVCDGADNVAGAGDACVDGVGACAVTGAQVCDQTSGALGIQAAAGWCGFSTDGSVKVPSYRTLAVRGTLAEDLLNVDCPPKEVVVGYTAWTDSTGGAEVLAGLQLRCAPIRHASGVPTLGQASASHVIGATDGTQHVQDCPAGSVVTGYRGRYGANQF